MLRKFDDLFHFSKWMIPLNVLGFLKDRVGDFILGRISGSHTLGVFSISSQLAAMPSTELVAPINRALLPAYARLKEDPVALARQYVSTMGAIAILAVPAIAGLAATADLVVAVLLGEKWREAAPVLAVMAFFGITQILQSNAYAAFLAIGKPRLVVQTNAFHVAILVLCLALITPRYGAIGAAWAFVIAALIAIPVSFFAIVRNLQLRIRDLVGVLWRPLLSSTVMYAVLMLFGKSNVWGRSPLENIETLFLQVLLGACTYCLASYVFWILSRKPPGAEDWILRQLASKLTRKADGLP
jgi:O-antigen/teichoic acid export membrane protein